MLHYAYFSLPAAFTFVNSLVFAKFILILIKRILIDNE
jgi:hypothetical protein